MARRTEQSGSSKRDERAKHESRNHSAGVPLFRIQIRRRKESETAPLTIRGLDFPVTAVLGRPVNPGDVETYKEWFKNFIEEHLEGWKPKGFDVDQIAFAIEVDAKPFGMGVGGTVQVTMTKSKSPARLRLRAARHYIRTPRAPICPVRTPRPGLRHLSPKTGDWESAAGSGPIANGLRFESHRIWVKPKSHCLGMLRRGGQQGSSHPLRPGVRFRSGSLKGPASTYSSVARG